MSGSRRLPRTLFGGRMRTSTALLGAAFVGVLLLWYAVRPDPALVTEEVVRVRTTRSVEKTTERKPVVEERAPAQVQQPVVPSPTRTATPKPKRTPGVSSTLPATPGAPVAPQEPGLLPGPTQPPGTEPGEQEVPVETPTPTTTSAPRKPGLFDNVPGARAPQRAPSTPSEPAESAEPVDAETPAAAR